MSVNYTTSNGTASSGSDYTSTSGVLTIPANATSGTISVPVLGDLLDENNETFTVTISNAVNAAITTAVGTGTIVDNDALPALTINNPSVVEGDNGNTNLTFTVTLSPASGRSVNVSYATANGTASSGTDYISNSGTLTFTAGVTTQTINVVVRGDTTVEPNETVLVNLSNPVNATIATTTGTGTITNDDPKINISDASVTEGQHGLDQRRVHGDVVRGEPVGHRERQLRHHRRHGNGRDGLHHHERHAHVRAGGDLAHDPGSGAGRHDRRTERDVHRDVVQPGERHNCRRLGRGDDC